MSDISTLAMDAHGGLDRWRKFKTVSALLLQGGVLCPLKGQDGILRDVHITVDCKRSGRHIAHSGSADAAGWFDRP